MLRVGAILAVVALLLIPGQAAATDWKQRTCAACGVVVRIAHEPPAVATMEGRTPLPNENGYNLVGRLDNGRTVVLHHFRLDGLSEGARVRVVQGRAQLQ
jgi:hypothetical protein